MFWNFVPVIGKIIDKIFPDTEAADLAKLELMKLEQSGDIEKILAQLEINKEQAKHHSMFVAGARPFIMWMCGIILGVGAVGKVFIPVCIALMPVFGYTDVAALKEASAMIADVDISIYVTLLSGLLGLGAMRSFDKVKGVATKEIKK